jgi:hypothetical protein
MTEDPSTMRTLIAIPVSLLCLAFAGCGSVHSAKDTVREHWTARYEGRTKAFATEQKEAFAAAKYAAGQLGFRMTKGGAAQGILEAVSTVQSDASLRGSRQMSLKLRISKESAGVSVTVLLTEIVADDFNKASAMGMETALKDSPLYELYFGHMGQYLSGKK